ncbi:MAG: hypothetical protein Q9P01_21065 [Anaerolineae bacterium]|nr:hypothetical protein [Anaerolineae bacterium]
MKRLLWGQVWYSLIGNFVAWMAYTTSNQRHSFLSVLSITTQYGVSRMAQGIICFQHGDPEQNWK